MFDRIVTVMQNMSLSCLTFGYIRLSGDMENWTSMLPYTRMLPRVSCRDSDGSSTESTEGVAVDPRG
jgi:hypothetical protein